jgi:hypothetical protein
MIDRDDSPPCARCGSETRFVLQLHPSGAEAGARIYYCMHCRHHTWQDFRQDFRQDLRNTQRHPPVSPIAENRAPPSQQQQQQQTQPDDDDAEPP